MNATPSNCWNNPMTKKVSELSTNTGCGCDDASPMSVNGIKIVFNGLRSFWPAVAAHEAQNERPDCRLERCFAVKVRPIHRYPEACFTAQIEILAIQEIGILRSPGVNHDITQRSFPLRSLL